MNLALFVTQANLSMLPRLVEQMAASQQELVNGALVVVFDSALKPKHIAFTLPLAARFKVSASLPVQVNGSHAEHEQIAAMFSAFLTTAYSRYPGPWLLFDEPALPKEINWMQAALRQHGAYGSKMTGRAITNPGSARPVGPITLELDFKTLKFLRFPTRQNWRERGQFLFARTGFQLVPAEQWLFTLEKVEATQPELDLEPKIGHFRGAMTIPGVAELPDEHAARYIFKEDGTCERAPDSAETNPANIFVEPNPEYFTPPLESLTDDELRDTIRVATGKSPHHFTGREKLLSMARELTTPIPA